MIFLSPHTASTLAPNTTEQSWVMFVQVNPPVGGIGPIKIQGARGSQVSSKLREIVMNCPYEAFIVGLVPTDAPDELEATIQTQFDSTRIHHDWFAPTVELLTLIEQIGQQALQELLDQARPGGLPENAIDIEAMAAILGVSTKTVRRLVKAGEIPYLRLGKALRFVAADVIASLERREL